MAQLSKIPTFKFELTPTTAASILDMFTAMHVHAKRVKDEEGSDAVWKTCQQSMPFYNALTEYVNRYL